MITQHIAAENITTEALARIVRNALNELAARTDVDPFTFEALAELGRRASNADPLIVTVGKKADYHYIRVGDTVVIHQPLRIVTRAWDYVSQLEVRLQRSEPQHVDVQVSIAEQAVQP